MVVYSEQDKYVECHLMFIKRKEYGLLVCNYNNIKSASIVGIVPSACRCQKMAEGSLPLICLVTIWKWFPSVVVEEKESKTYIDFHFTFNPTSKLYTHKISMLYVREEPIPGVDGQHPMNSVIVLEDVCLIISYLRSFLFYFF